MTEWSLPASEAWAWIKGFPSCWRFTVPEGRGSRRVRGIVFLSPRAQPAYLSRGDADGGDDHRRCRIAQGLEKAGMRSAVVETQGYQVLVPFNDQPLPSLA